MRLADYIVSYSLQINSRCLRYLADSHGLGRHHPAGVGDELVDLALDAQPVLAENTLIRDARRLLSMWTSLQLGYNGDPGPVQAQVARMAGVVEQLNLSMAPTRLALRLASLAVSEADAKDLLIVARAIPVQPNLVWGQLNEDFMDDSAMWRDANLLEHVTDQDLLKGIAGTYRRGYKQVNKLADDWQQAAAEPDVYRRLSKINRQTQLVAHQLELLRPGLSDKMKQQLWYLDKFADAFRTRAGLLQLKHLSHSDAVGSLVKKRVVKNVCGYVDQQVIKVHKRLQRLAEPSFNLRPKRLEGALRQAMNSLGLVGVATLPKREVSADASRQTV